MCVYRDEVSSDERETENAHNVFVLGADRIWSCRLTFLVHTQTHPHQPHLHTHRLILFVLSLSHILAYSLSLFSTLSLPLCLCLTAWDASENVVLSLSLFFPLCLLICSQPLSVGRLRRKMWYQTSSLSANVCMEREKLTNVTLVMYL